MTGPSAYYDSYWSRPLAPRQAGMYPALEKLLAPHVRGGRAWLDVGCGDASTIGRWSRERGLAYTGVDVSAEAVRRAREKGFEAHVLEQSSQLPFDDGRFDVAVCLEVLEHLFEPQLTVAEVLRVLRPGGVLVATAPNAAYWRRRLDLLALGRWNPAGDERSLSEPWRDPHIRFFTVASLRALLVSNGFDDACVGGHWGVLAADLPGVSRVVTRRAGGRDLERGASRPYRVLERTLPALFAFRLHALARRPRA